MKKIICAVKDVQAGIFMPPFTIRSRGEALRMCMDACADSQSLVSKHPCDFALYEIGTFDEEKGNINSLVTPVHVANFSDLVEHKGE